MAVTSLVAVVAPRTGKTIKNDLRGIVFYVSCRMS